MFDGEYEEEWIDEVFGGSDENYNDKDECYYDDTSGVDLPKSLVMTGRQKELDWVHGIKLYDKVPRQQAIDKNIKPITVRCGDANKGDDDNMNIISRLVGRELAAKTKETRLAHEVFSAMPPWEMIKILLGLLVIDGVPGPVEPPNNNSDKIIIRNDGGGSDNDELMLGIYDISRAHFMPKVKRELYIEIPKEDLTDKTETSLDDLIETYMDFEMLQLAGSKFVKNFYAPTTTKQGLPIQHYFTMHNEAHVEPFMEMTLMYSDVNKTPTT